jgi:hypothetical protein
MLAHDVAGRFPSVETIRAEVRKARLTPATDAELREIDERVTDALANNAIEGITPDGELLALLAMLRDERVGLRDYDRFYDRYISVWIAAAR